MKQMQLYDISSSNPITRQQARDVLGIKGGEGFTWRKLNKAVCHFSEPEFQNNESSQKLAQNINAARRNLSGKDSPNKYTKQNVEYMRGKITGKDFVSDIGKVVDVVLYYLEHGVLTEEQRCYLQQIVSASGKLNKDFMKYIFGLAVVTELTAVLGLILICYGKQELCNVVVYVYVALGLLSSLVELYKAIKPIYYIRKLNQASR